MAATAETCPDWPISRGLQTTPLGEVKEEQGRRGNANDVDAKHCSSPMVGARV